MTGLGRLSIAFLILLLMPQGQLAASEASALQTPLERQREAFREAYARAELGDWRVADSHADTLQDYLLWPDLRAAWLKTRVRNDDYAGVDEFLDTYASLKPARELRYHYALKLGKDGEHQRYFDIYQAFYQGRNIASLDCLALQAEIEAGRDKRIKVRAREKWLTGYNQVDECDPVFSYMADTGLLNYDLYRQRFELTLDARQFGLARYVARSLPAAYRERAATWSRAAAEPADFVEQYDTSVNTVEYREQLMYATERVAYRQPSTAANLWDDIEDEFTFSADDRNRVQRYIALWSARRHEDSAYKRLVGLNVQDESVRAWTVRAALKAGDLKSVAGQIDAMPADERAEEEWRYWRAAAADAAGDDELALELFSALAEERSYYGFLAADRLEQPYQLLDRPLVANEESIRELARRNELQRARELLAVGLDSRGRSEWDDAIALLDQQEKIQASILAQRWGWHSRAIATAARAGHFDDLKLRFPLPYQPIFEQHARSARIENSWAYGVARSESLFMRDIRSSAGAIGLMQLMPATGRETAKSIQLPYSGNVTLTDPDSNIRLGTTYLSKMLERFDGNRILATAAYNAGPHNVASWLPEEDSVNALVWIENIPFTETREYVRRVFAMETIFQWRLDGEPQRLTPKLTDVQPPATERMARSD